MTTPYFYECLHCGKPAFDLIDRPTSGTPIRSAIARHLDGSPMAQQTPFLCDSCGRCVAEGASWPMIPGTLRTRRIRARQP